MVAGLWPATTDEGGELATLTGLVCTPRLPMAVLLITGPGHDILSLQACGVITAAMPPPSVGDICRSETQW